MDNIALLILGIFISVIGIVNMTGNISTIHSYNRRKVKEEDVPIQRGTPQGGKRGGEKVRCS